MNIELINKLWQKTRVEGNHWLYINRVNKDGHGVIWYNGSEWIVSRLSLCIYLKISYRGDWFGCHICEHPNCWNPLHLYVGSNSSNQYDSVLQRTHRNTKKDFCINGHEFNQKNTYWYKGKRQCKLCKYLRLKDFRNKRLRSITQ